MFKALVQAYARFKGDELFLPTAHKWRVPTWVIEFDENNRYFIKGPYGREDHAPLPAPDRQRSGKVAGDNLKPKLLFDDPRYTLGLNFGGDKNSEVDLMHTGYLNLISSAADSTKEPLLAKVAYLLQSSLVNELKRDFISKRKTELEARAKERSRRGRKGWEVIFNELWRESKGELITFSFKGTYLVRLPAVQRFWAEHLKDELVIARSQCSICGEENDIVRLIPGEVTIQGQNCQITSFNERAFESFGKRQTPNASICFECATKAIDTLRYLLNPRSRHSYNVVGDKGATSSLDRITAVFWTAQSIKLEPSELNMSDFNFDTLEDFLGRITASESPPAIRATLETIKRSLKAPYKPTPLTAQTDFHLMLVAANNRRFVLRDHISQPVSLILEQVERWLQASEIVDYFGQQRVPSLITLTKALAYRPGSRKHNLNPTHARTLYRTAYTGTSPSYGVLAKALSNFKNPKLFELADSHDGRLSESRQTAQLMLWGLASVIKLWIAYRKGEKGMEQLEERRGSVPYLLGRLLAWLERIQWEASGRTLERTIAQTHFGIASSAPALAFGQLLKSATIAHLPKLKKSHDNKQAGFAVNAEKELERIASSIGKLPKTLTLEEQAEFALGFYHQRADFRAKSKERKEAATEVGHE